MTATQFRRLALGLPDAVESSHFDHPDFAFRTEFSRRSAIPIRAGHGQAHSRATRRTAAHCAESISSRRRRMGRSGSTLVFLPFIKVTALRPLLQRAWENIAVKKPATDSLRRPSAVVRRAPG